ncbi:hypothetical protein [Pseudomonas sp. URMO17WK12:I11]|uniref:hypothetical protein n=1 Tax=Pseudomonas sp. URMO17WK12:I11 TaxID=1283291 RepID=UPI0018D700FB|nr:hypothetical protein [Pseudomonas sp. URMO17WK12:I11]MBH3364800.1 hypothetical protein [Pseudomonas sp. URMO17WK12:I11]
MDTSKMRDLKALAVTCLPHQPLRFMRSHGALYIRNDSGIVFDVHQNRSFPELMAQNKDYAEFALACTPDTVLALFAEIDRLERKNANQAESIREYQDLTVGGDVSLGMLKADLRVTTGERDELKAENEALRTGQAIKRLSSDEVREAFNGAYYQSRDNGSDGEQCRAGVLAVIEAATAQAVSND